jgi:transcriptional regulator with XRE-family HTH domain
MRLKELRKQKNISQTDLAKALNMKQTTISSYEKGKTQPPIEVLIDIANHFNVSLDYLLERQYENKIDLASLSETKQNIIKMVTQLNELHAIKVEVYAQSKLDEQEIMHNNTILNNSHIKESKKNV